MEQAVQRKYEVHSTGNGLVVVPLYPVAVQDVLQEQGLSRSAGLVVRAAPLNTTEKTAPQPWTRPTLEPGYAYTIQVIAQGGISAQE